jgi:hypothetical protein
LNYDIRVGAIPYAPTNPRFCQPNEGLAVRSATRVSQTMPLIETPAPECLSSHVARAHTLVSGQVIYEGGPNF